MRAFLLLSFLAAAVLRPPYAAAQFPGEFAGVVADRVTGTPLAGVYVLAESGSSTHTASDGSFRLTGLAPGATLVRFDRAGYLRHERRVEVRNGVVRRAVVELEPAPWLLEPLSVTSRRVESGAVSIERREIERSQARSAADVIRSSGAAVVRQARPGGPASVSIRGSSPEAVLVLVDGVPLNDPITGVADLSAVSAVAIERLVVRPGAGSTAFGAGARAGVVSIETRVGGLPATASVGGGSLGHGRLEATAGTSAGAVEVGVGGTADAVSGAFDFELPPESGGGVRRRTNAEARALAGWVSAGWSGSIDRIDARVSYDRIRRGLPGKDVTPSPEARSRRESTRASLGWRRTTSSGRWDLSVFTHHESSRVWDPLPPLGLPFDTRTGVSGLGYRGRWGTDRPHGPIDRMAVWSSALHQQVTGGGLSAEGGIGRTDVSVGGGTDLLGLGSDRGLDLDLTASVAAHHDPTDGGVRVTHDVALGRGWGALRLTAVHRSAFRAPGLADQHFEEGVAVAPNPDLRAESVPGEFAVRLEASGSLSYATFRARAEVFGGAVRGMIVWAPDFRFVWSPRNYDVRRHGVEVEGMAGGTLRSAPVIRRWSVRARVARQVVEYDRERSSQVAYRPRHTALVALELAGTGWSLGLDATRTGARYPVPSPVNELPAFWTLDARMRWSPRASRNVELSLDARRPLNRQSNVVFGYAHPGRTFDVTFRVRGSGL